MEEQLFNQYWEQYKNLIYKLANRNEVKGLDFDDIVQELMMVLYKCIKNYKEGKAKFSTYLTKSCIYKIMELRKGYSQFTVSLDNIISGEEGDLTFINNLEDRKMPTLSDYLEQIEDGELLYLHYMAGIPQNEIAKIEKVTAGRIAQRIKKAREEFKDKFGGEFGG